MLSPSLTQLLFGCLCWVIFSPDLLGDDDDDNQRAVFFEQKIRPALVEHCYRCHSQAEKQVEGGLRIDSAAGAKSGGNGGPAFIAGDPEHSLLIQAIRYQDDKLKMPPDAKLSDEVIRDFERWIAEGAFDPRSENSPDGPPAKQMELDDKQRWSFVPPKDPPVPSIVNSKWARTDIDRFLLSKLEQEGLSPLAEVSRTTWLRRVTFSLIGLPPTPEEIRAFTDDSSLQAYESVVDRLLSSPRYGERWGRHWLDVVHYSDTTGCNSDFPVPQNYRYRNWVIDAWNDDMPFDTFVTQQIAGDLLADELEAQSTGELSDADQATVNRLRIATGFVANARRFGSRHEDYPQHLTIEDTIDTIGKSFLGVSLACARCHDHKFDPVSNQDYYGLYSYFHNTQYPWPGIETKGHQEKFVPLISRPRYDAAIAARKKRQDQLDAAVRQLEKDRDAAQAEARSELEKQVSEAKQQAESFAKRGLDIEVAYAVGEGPKRETVRVQYKGDPSKPGPEVAMQTPSSLGGSECDSKTNSGRLHLAKWIANQDNPTTARVIVNRIWKYHFGVGIVPTPNDFGKQGKSPSHPDLLDFLAHRYMESNWSNKTLHRSIVLSQIYRTGSVGDASLEIRDPNNVWLRGFRRQRLDAESIRDAMLSVSGQLDLEPGNAHPFPKQKDWKFTQHNPFKALYETNKRSVYVMTQRISRHPYLSVFDGADPSTSTPARNVSTTPLQALYLLNDNTVHELGEKLAERLLGQDESDETRIRNAFLLCFSRAVRDDELLDCKVFLERSQRAYSVHDKSSSHNMTSDSKRLAWSAFSRSLFRLNEFVYVD
jgi:hypothetical protein